MPLYIYKAVNRDGQVVTNRVEELNKFVLLKKIKSNGLMPIAVTQIRGGARAARNAKKQKKNIESSNSILKTVREQEIARSMRNNNTMTEKLKKALFSNVGDVKIKTKDIIIFTQNFYLLKKANFNNIHALSTIIENTENPSFKAILEDILLGVEAGDTMYSTMEYYSGVFPAIYINMIKVGELSRSINKSIRTGCKIS